MSLATPTFRLVASSNDEGEKLKKIKTRSVTSVFFFAKSRVSVKQKLATIDSVAAQCLPVSLLTTQWLARTLL